MNDFMGNKIVLLDIGVSESAQYLVVVNVEDVGAAKRAIADARAEYSIQRDGEDYCDFLEDHIERALRSSGIEFSMPRYQEY